jgi:hypothetical protein
MVLGQRKHAMMNRERNQEKRKRHFWGVKPWTDSRGDLHVCPLDWKAALFQEHWCAEVALVETDPEQPSSSSSSQCCFCRRGARRLEAKETRATTTTHGAA